MNLKLQLKRNIKYQVPILSFGDIDGFRVF